MSLLVIGISHKTAPIQIREKLAFNKNQLASALTELSRVLNGKEVTILSTCHRTEIYSNTNQPTEIKTWLSEHKEIGISKFEEHFYQHIDIDAVKHIMSVASGIDSNIIGEPQILGQVKSAYHLALGVGVAGKLLGRLFQSSFSLAKQVRTDTDIGKSPISLAFAAVKMATRVFSNIKTTRVLFIGAGETVSLCARYFHEKGVNNMLFTNRTFSRAVDLAQYYAATAFELSELNQHLSTVDIIVTATGSESPLINKQMMQQALSERKSRPVFMIDLGLPRDIDNDVTNLEQVYVYTVDDLKAVIDDNYHLRMQAVSVAKEMIATQANLFMNWLASLNSVEAIKAYRLQAESIRDKAVQRAIRQVANGENSITVINKLGRLLTNQLIHEPTIAIKNGIGSNELLSIKENK